MGKGDGFLRLETVETRSLVAFCSVTSISEPARMLGNGREMCTRHPGGDWAASVLFPVQLRRGPGSCALHAFLCLPGQSSSEEHGFPVCHQVPGSVSPGLVNPGKDGYVS